MLSISEAYERILATVAPLNTIKVELSEALGMTLAEQIAATEDSPPFDKSLMDGYAVRSADLVSGAASLKVIEIVTAGKVPTKDIGPGEATQIMTGAPLPNGADLVVKIEETTPGIDRVEISTKSAMPKTNIIRQGTSVRAGDIVFKAGTKLNGSRIGALAELGHATIQVYRPPTVAVLATGDELVPVETKPGPGQIRNSNQAMLVAQLQAAGARPVPISLARDVRRDLHHKIQAGLIADMLILSGGVSAGTLDLVPSELAAAGVREVFHQVALKPGKPIWFGVRDASKCVVFGLPGNPVSSLVCCELFVRTAIRRMMGEANALPQTIPAKLDHDHAARADRPTYHPADLSWTADGPVVKLVPWHGSSDLCGTVAANSMAFFSGEERQYQAGDIVPVIGW